MTTVDRVIKVANGWVKDPGPDTNLSDGGMDSLDFVEMLMDIEDEFGLDCDDDDWMMKAGTPAAIAAIIDGAIDGKAKKGPIRVRRDASR